MHHAPSIGCSRTTDANLQLLLTASSVASSSGSLVDASGYKYSEKDMKPGKIKLKKTAGKSAKGKKPDQSGRRSHRHLSCQSSSLIGVPLISFRPNKQTAKMPSQARPTPPPSCPRWTRRPWPPSPRGTPGRTSSRRSSASTASGPC